MQVNQIAKLIWRSGHKSVAFDTEFKSIRETILDLASELQLL